MAHDDILSKAEALLRRHRPTRYAERAAPAVDFPVLTEIVQESQPPPPPPPSEPPEPEREPEPPVAAVAPAPPLSEEELAQLEQDLRLQLLDLMGPEFERLIEAKVHERLGVKIDEVMTLTRTVLEAEIRSVVREALAEVIAAETERLKIELNLG
jgi:hypothetical protein